MKKRLEVQLGSVLSKKFDSKILYSLLVILTLVAAGPLLLYGWKSIELSRDTLQTNLREFQLNLARSISHEVALTIDSIQNQVAVIARSMEIGAGGGEFQKTFDDLKKGQGGLVQLVTENGTFYSVRIYDAKGNWTEAGVMIEDEDVTTDLEVAFDVCRKGVPYTSPRPILVRTLGQPVLVSAAPINWKGSLVGVLAVVASLEQVQRSLKEKSREGVEAYLVDQEGVVLAHPDAKRILSRSTISDTTLYREMKSTGGRASATIPFQAKTAKGLVDYVATFDWVPEMKWWVVVQVEQRRVFYSVEEMRWSTIQWGLLAVLLAIGAGVFFAKRISTPIQELARGATALSQKDFSRRITVRSRNEIGQLAETFNVMSDEIHSYIELLKDAAEENSQLFMGSIRMLAAAIDEKDPYTHGHSERVAQYSKAIARYLGLATEEVEKVGISALLHDVGKIGIKDNVLRKPDVLTSEEFEIMKQHPIKGATIMSPVEQLRDIIPGIKYHHESFDGTGYPDRLKGEGIPMVARIIAVADTFDAMTTNRPYQKAMDGEYALRKIAAGTGRRFDGSVVEALGRALQSGDLRQTEAALATPVAVTS